MSPSISSRRSSIDKLDFDANRRRPSSQYSSHDSNDGNFLSPTHSFFSDVVSGAIARDRQNLSRRATLTISFICAILNCLCAGSILAYSLYGPLFISHLRYTQYQVNAIVTAAELCMYGPVPLVGWFVDRYGPRPLSLASAIFFGGGYALAAGVYRSGTIAREVELHGPHAPDVQHGWPFSVMILAFLLVGTGTICMYMSAVPACAKNFGRGKHKGLALGAPIAAFGLSGMWQSQVGSYFFKEQGTGELDVFRYFIFLTFLQFTVGVIGSVGLRVVDEETLIEEAANDMERSGLLSHSDISPHTEEPTASSTRSGYGTLPSSERRPSIASSHKTRSLKTTLLNRETRLFLSDKSMWLLTLGFFLTSGPGETYQNNVGTLLPTAYPPLSKPPKMNTSATHVSLIAITSTIARLATGTITDALAPTAARSESTKPSRTVSRLTFLLGSTALFSIALLLLATPLPHHVKSIFPALSALVGLGYGALFSLVPIIVSVVWGVENFGTNWGIVAVVPAPGAALWGVIYSWVFETGMGAGDGEGEGGSGQCYGPRCYQATFLAMAIASWTAMAAWVLAWRMWKQRGVLV